MKIEGKNYRTIWFENNEVKIIDQTKLPHEFKIKSLKTVRDSINAIKNMEVRGAPLIGATAAYGLVLSIIEKNNFASLKKSSEDLINSRPTAINLKWAVDRMIKKLSGVNSEKILEILRQFNRPLAAPSANLSGKISSTSIDHVLKNLNQKIDAIVDGGNSTVGVESTIVTLTRVPTILRTGFITPEALSLIHI